MVKSRVCCDDSVFLHAAIRRRELGWADDDHPLVFLYLGSSGIGAGYMYVTTCTCLLLTFISHLVYTILGSFLI